MEIRFTDTGMFEQLMNLYSDVYNHELCSPELQTYMRLRLTYLIGSECNVRKCLERGVR